MATEHPDFVPDPGHKPILVAVDFSADSEAALLWACDLAVCKSSRLHLLHVIHDPIDKPGFYDKVFPEQTQTLQAAAEIMMADFIKRLQKKHPEIEVIASATTSLVEGLPPGRIVEVADQLQACAIVTGCRGMTGLPHLLLGSVAERVVELARMPVIVVKSEQTKSIELPQE